MSQETRIPQTPTSNAPSRESDAPRKQPWGKPVVVETSCGLEINCYAPAKI